MQTSHIIFLRTRTAPTITQNQSGSNQRTCRSHNCCTRIDVKLFDSHIRIRTIISIYRYRFARQYMHFRIPIALKRIICFVDRNVACYNLRHNDVTHRLHSRAFLPLQCQHSAVTCGSRKVNSVSEVHRVVVFRSSALSARQRLAQRDSGTGCFAQMSYYRCGIHTFCIHFDHTAVLSPFYEVGLREDYITRRYQAQLFYTALVKTPYKRTVLDTQRIAIVCTRDRIFRVLRIGNACICLCQRPPPAFTKGICSNSSSALTNFRTIGRIFRTRGTEQRCRFPASFATFYTHRQTNVLAVSSRDIRRHRSFQTINICGCCISNTWIIDIIHSYLRRSWCTGRCHIRRHCPPFTIFLTCNHKVCRQMSSDNTLY